VKLLRYWIDLLRYPRQSVYWIHGDLYTKGSLRFRVDKQGYGRLEDFDGSRWNEFALSLREDVYEI
jgi:hypothetical protein